MTTGQILVKYQARQGWYKQLGVETEYKQLKEETELTTSINHWSNAGHHLTTGQYLTTGQTRAAGAAGAGEAAAERHLITGQTIFDHWSNNI